MMISERRRSERIFHDRQAEQRAQVLREADLRFEDAAYLAHESWIAPALAELGDVAGRRVLDLGCGHGMAAVVLARRGACVTACDLSPGYVREAQARANDVSVSCVAAAGEALPFADEAFDRVWGNAALHHLAFEQAIPELRRVLRPGGLAIFCEPWGENPCLAWARNYLPYHGKERTRDEMPLRRGDLARLRRHFPRLWFRGHQLLAMAGRLGGRGRWLSGLERCDALLLERFPPLHRLCRYVVLGLPK